MQLKLLAIALLASTAFAQEVTPPPGGGSGSGNVCASSPGAGTNGYVLEATSGANPPTC